MKLRFCWIMANLGAAICLSGCTTTETVAMPPPRAIEYKLTVVESSRNRELTPQETEQLRAYVLQFLQGQGTLTNNPYFVRVDFPPEAPGATPEFLVVQITPIVTASYTLLTSYPATPPRYYDPYDVRYGYFGLLGYSYYDQFYYNRDRYYYRPPPTYYAPPHRPTDAHRKPDERNHPAPGYPDVVQHRPEDAKRKPGDHPYPTAKKPAPDRPRPDDERAHRPPTTGVTQNTEPGKRSGHQPSGNPGPLASTDSTRGGGGHSSPPPSYSPPRERPPSRESAPVREAAPTGNRSAEKVETRVTEQQER
jgi:hypothetical protein